MLGILLISAAAAATSPQNCAFDPDSGALNYAEEATPQFEAHNAASLEGDSFVFDGATYVKFGSQMEIDPAEVEAFAERDSVPLFIASGDYAAEVIYVMVSSAGCVFQRYGME